jgi:hypothetical protein
MNDEHGFDHTFGHQDGKSQEMQSNQGLRQAFVIPHQPAQLVEHLTQAEIALGSLFGPQGQIRREPRSPTPHH